MDRLEMQIVIDISIISRCLNKLMKKDDNAEKFFVYVIPGFKNRKGITHFENLTILREISVLFIVSCRN